MITSTKWLRVAKKSRFAKRLLQDNRGVTVLEFALITPVLLVFLIGGIELGYMGYIRSVANGVLERTARMASTGQMNDSQIDSFIRSQLAVITAGSDPATAVQISKLNYFNFSNVGAGETITADTVPVGVYNATDCYEDRNNDGVFNPTSGGAAGTGGADDIVFYEVTVTVPRLLPFESVMSMLRPNIDYNNGGTNTTIVKARTIIRNQPFATQVLVTRCD